MSATNRGAARVEKERHHPECWREEGHHACAIRKVEDLQRLSDSQEQALAMMERGEL